MAVEMDFFSSSHMDTFILVCFVRSALQIFFFLLIFFMVNIGAYACKGRGFSKRTKRNNLFFSVGALNGLHGSARIKD